jgi:hypothetical protein
MASAASRSAVTWAWYSEVAEQFLSLRTDLGVPTAVTTTKQGVGVDVDDALPDDQRTLVQIVGGDPVTDPGDGLGEVVLHPGQDQQARLFGVLLHDQDGPGGASEGDGAAAVLGLQLAGLVEVAHQQDGGAGPLGQVGKRGGRPPDAGVVVGVDRLRQVGGDRVNHQQLGLDLADRHLKAVLMLGQGQGPDLAVLVALQGHGGDAGEVGTVGQQPRHDGVGEVVLGADDHHAGCLPLLDLPGHRRAGGGAGGEVKGDGGLGPLWISLKDGHLAQGDPVRPQPVDVRPGDRVEHDVAVAG